MVHKALLVLPVHKVLPALTVSMVQMVLTERKVLLDLQVQMAQTE